MTDIKTITKNRQRVSDLNKKIWAIIDGEVVIASRITYRQAENKLKNVTATGTIVTINVVNRLQSVLLDKK